MSQSMRRGEIRVRPLGGAPGCLFMLLVSALVSIALTVLVNVMMR